MVKTGIPVLHVVVVIVVVICVVIAFHNRKHPFVLFK
jgi:hypothetical protein